jgi:hypothetical protein
MTESNSDVVSSLNDANIKTIIDNYDSIARSMTWNEQLPYKTFEVFIYDTGAVGVQMPNGSILQFGDVSGNISQRIEGQRETASQKAILLRTARKIIKKKFS